MFCLHTSYIPFTIVLTHKCCVIALTSEGPLFLGVQEQIKRSRLSDVVLIHIFTGRFKAFLYMCLKNVVMLS